MCIAKMPMLRCMFGKTRKDKSPNEQIREKVKVAPIVEKNERESLRQFGHIQRNPLSAPGRQCDDINLNQGGLGVDKS